MRSCACRHLVSAACAGRVRHDCGFGAVELSEVFAQALVFVAQARGFGGGHQAAVLECEVQALLAIGARGLGILRAAFRRHEVEVAVVVVDRGEGILELVVVEHAELVVDLRGLRRAIERALVGTNGLFVGAELCALVAEIHGLAHGVLLFTAGKKKCGEEKCGDSHRAESRSFALSSASTRAFTTFTRVFHL